MYEKNEYSISMVHLNKTLNSWKGSNIYYNLIIEREGIIYEN